MFLPATKIKIFLLFTLPVVKIVKPFSISEKGFLISTKQLLISDYFRIIFFISVQSGVTTLSR